MTISVDNSAAIQASKSVSVDPFPSAGGDRFVSFHLGERHYVIAAHDVNEVTRPLPVTRLPGAPPCLLGIAPLRSEILAVIDLRRMLGEPTSKNTDLKRKQLILKKSSDSEAAISFTVDRLGEIITIPSSGFRPDRRSGSLLLGEGEVDSITFSMVDASALSAVLASEILS